MTFEQERELADAIVSRYYKDDVNVVTVEDCPVADYLIDLNELDNDISQGTGNVIIRYVYDMNADVVYRYADF